LTKVLNGGFMGNSNPEKFQDFFVTVHSILIFKRWLEQHCPIKCTSFSFKRKTLSCHVVGI